MRKSMQEGQHIMPGTHAQIGNNGRVISDNRQQQACKSLVAKEIFNSVDHPVAVEGCLKLSRLQSQAEPFGQPWQILL